MNNTLQFLKDNPGVLVAVGLVTFATLFFGLFALGLSRAGASVRPIGFIAGFMAIVALPQVAFHVSQAMGWIPKRDLVWTFGKDANEARGAAREGVRYVARADALTIRDGRFTQPAAVFGARFDKDLVSDLRARMPGGPFERALAAEMAILPPGASMVVAHFRDAATAVDALQQYASMMVGALPPVGADGTMTITRTSDVAKALIADRTIVMVSAPDIETATRAIADAPLLQQVTATPASAADSAEDIRARDFWLYRPLVLASITLLLLLAAVAWFFRMSAWASEVPAAPGVSVADVRDLRSRLLSVNTMDVPFTIATSPDDSSLVIVTWRYADAKWVDLARARGMRRTHRILLRLDAADATVRPTEQMSSIDWSVGAGGADAKWVTSRGINFFEYRHERVFGLQIDSTGTFTPNLTYSYTFNLQEMKAPLIAAVTQAGWRWRPTLFHGPRWLAWLTD